jgi:RNA polymerase sigma factor (sigma-70 family)
VTVDRSEDRWREWSPQVLGALVRRFGDLDAAEDALQDALLAASSSWADDGVPNDPVAWLITVASRRLIDRWRSERARAAREWKTSSVAAPAVSEDDDSLTLLLLCCHPALPRAGQIALTLRAVGGLTTSQIARAFLVPEPTIAQRISRAKSHLRRRDVTFELPAPGSGLDDRLAAVMQVLYVIFTEGHSSTNGTALSDPSITAEAIRITRMLHAAVPDHGEVAGLLALMLLTEARRPARTNSEGALVPLADQDRSRWDTELIAEGTALLAESLPATRIGAYQLQAAIAAVHDEAPTWKATDWPQILQLYRLLLDVTPGPVVRLSAAVALAMVEGPEAGLLAVAALGDDPLLRRSHRLPAVRGHLLEEGGDLDAARADYLRAATLATSIPEQRYLRGRAARLDPPRSLN